MWQLRTYQHLSILILALLLFGSCAGSAPRVPTPGNRIGAPEEAAPPQRNEIRPRFVKGRITVDVFPRRGEGYIDLAVRIASRPKRWSQLKSWNKNRRFPQVGQAIPVPFSYLNQTYRQSAIKALFRNDQPTPAGWEHTVTFPGETMWFIAETFSGDGANYPAIQEANGLKRGQAIALGQKILVPAKLLGDEWETPLPQHEDLEFEKDARGKLYALYTLKRGEALYSSVVVRFTGRVEPPDVEEMARKILKINGLSDPRKIPAGKKIKIPFDDLSEDFVTGGAPDRVTRVQRSGRKSNLHIILDPGHGGADPGAIQSGQTEDELAYDVMVRVQRALERGGATVHPTVFDPVDASRPRNGRRLRNGKSERLQTTPPYTIRDARVGVNMRVYLINAIYAKLKKRGVPDDRIFMISIHMDHLHPSMRGAMIYYPNASERSKSFKANGRIYGRYAESRNTRVRFNSSANRRAEAFSYDFSRNLINTFKRNRIPVHSHRPIRPFVYRKNRKWTPGVIKYSKVPTSILLEVVNIANRRDFSHIQDSSFRQRVAEAIAATIL